jgi:hypothetical protein
VTRREATAGKDESAVTFGYRDRETRRDKGATAARTKCAGLDRHQVTAGITVVGVRGGDGIRVESLGENFHSGKATQPRSRR